MRLLKRYLEGDTVAVYEEIERIGQKAFKKDNLPDVKAVLTETMTRVAHNLDVIYAALVEEKYCFKKDPRYDFTPPLLKPRWGTQFYIYRLERAVRPFGHIPLSLKIFYRVVGACDFAWDYKVEEEIPWEGADPIQLDSIADLLAETRQMEPPEDSDPIGIPISADYYHKDNISGGPPYSIELTERPQIDSRFLNEEHETTFVNYLRITLDGCGFSKAFAAKDRPDFINYCKKVKPLLKPI